MSLCEEYCRCPLEADFAITVGGAKQIPGVGTIDVSLFTKRAHYVWKDPYVTDRNREDTHVTDYGVNLRYDDFSYSQNILDVDDDEIGERFSELKRNGKSHSLIYAPKNPLSQDSELDPKLVFGRSQLEGQSQRANNFTLAVGYQFEQPRYKVSLEGKAARSVFDEVYPIFGETRKSQTYTGTVFFT